MAACLALVIACDPDQTQRCIDGRLCATGTVCDVERQRCIVPEHQAACSDKMAGDECALGAALGRCVFGVCTLPVCGDGVAYGPALNEPCDGDDLAGQTCRSRGFYEPDGLGCRSDCTLDTSECQGWCGDGVRNGGVDDELCDRTDLDENTCQSLGYYQGDLACRPNCRFDTSRCSQHCGDGIVNGPELCDGRPPPGHCVGLGYDVGSPRCSASCGLSLTSCGRIGWKNLNFGESVTDIWGDGRHLVAVGGQRVHVYDGSSWSIVSQLTELPPPRAVWGTSGTNFWVGTFEGLARWDGEGWRDLTEEFRSIWGLWGSAPDDVYAAHEHGLARFDGTSWSDVPLPVTTRIRDLWGSAADDIFAVGLDRTILHFDGQRWSIQTQTPGAYALVRVWGRARDDVYASNNTELLHFDGNTWSPVAMPAEYTIDIGGVPGGDLYVLTHNHLWRYDGRVWHLLAVNGPGNAHFTELWVDSPTRVWGGTVSGVEQFPGSAYTDDVTAALVSHDAIWAASPQDYWVATHVDDTSSIHHVTDEVWRSPHVVSGKVRDLLGFAGDVYAAGSFGLLHHDGTAWEPIVSDVPLNVLWGRGRDDLYACGDGDRDGNGARDSDAVLLHFDGRQWTRVPGPACDRAWGAAPDDVYAVEDGRAYHWDGTSWAELSFGPVSYRVDAVWGWSRDDVYVIDRGWVVHFDGRSWRYVAQLHTSADFELIAPVAPDDVFAASRYGLTAHFDGERWSPMTWVNAYSNDVWATPSRIFFARPDRVTTLSRTVRWGCLARERDCGDAVDDDCDGWIDRLDRDCSP